MDKALHPKMLAHSSVRDLLSSLQSCIFVLSRSLLHHKILTILKKKQKSFCLLIYMSSCQGITYRNQHINKPRAHQLSLRANNKEMLTLLQCNEFIQLARRTPLPCTDSPSKTGLIFKVNQNTIPSNLAQWLINLTLQFTFKMK